MLRLKSCFFHVQYRLIHQRVRVRLLEVLRGEVHPLFYRLIGCLFYRLIFLFFHSFTFSSTLTCFFSFSNCVMRSVRPLVWDSSSIFRITNIASSSSSKVLPVTTMT